MNKVEQYKPAIVQQYTTDPLRGNRVRRKVADPIPGRSAVS